MSQFTTEDMSRLVAAGTRDQLKTTIEVVAGIGLVHINDYSADEEGLSMGIPVEEAEDISRQLTRMRGCASQVESGDQRNLLPAGTSPNLWQGRLTESSRYSMRSTASKPSHPRMRKSWRSSNCSHLSASNWN